ncbi:hypothetical protein N7492_006822 [Penicillium capsulatum]|uniref:Uncharacterized protein n=1 Tax=Penicillium capsulatum TaxID=69766 RepID=A0A9W9I263_9EURO|nr:hypothetical protein N7492_006822 [Penicillium capsulatum]KAJ6116657.1 hypothetical protein N7512_006382 [Penicillium capsulatum]
MASNRDTKTSEGEKCRHCGKPGHKAGSNKCILEMQKAEIAGLNRKLSKMTQEREDRSRTLREVEKKLEETRKELAEAKREIAALKGR